VIEIVEVPELNGTDIHWGRIILRKQIVDKPAIFLETVLKGPIVLLPDQVIDVVVELLGSRALPNTIVVGKKDEGGSSSIIGGIGLGQTREVELEVPCRKKPLTLVLRGC
jgi:hypothetical protein